MAGDNLFGAASRGSSRSRARGADAPVIAVHDVGGDLARMHEYGQIEVDAEGRIVFLRGEA